MFEDLHALAQSATLLIVVTAEGDALRVSVTPTLTGDKPKAHALRPLSLLGTAAELDTDFGAALIAWQAPRKSLVQQAEDAAGTDDEEEEEINTKKAPAAKPAASKAKPGPKKKESAAAPAPKTAPAEEEKKVDPADNKKEAEPEFALEAEAPAVADPVVEAPPVEVAPPAVDDKTLDLF